MRKLFFMAVAFVAVVSVSNVFAVSSYTGNASAVAADTVVADSSVAAPAGTVAAEPAAPADTVKAAE